MIGLNRMQFLRTMDAAADIVYRSANGTAVLDPLTVAWAQQMIRNNSHRLKHPTHIENLLKLWDDDLLAGLTSAAISERLFPRPKHNAWQDIGNALKAGLLFGLVERRHSLYFVSRAAREAALPEFEKARAERQAKKAKPLRIPKLAIKSELRPAQKIVKPKQPKEPKMTSPKPAPTTAAAKVSKIMDRGAAVTPFNHDGQLLSNKAKRQAGKLAPAPKGPADTSRAKVTLCPSSKDTRYTPALPPEGGEFTQAWRQLRGQA